MGCADQAVLCLKLHAGLHKAALVVIGLDAAKAFRVDLVDRDMKVKMACVDMRGRQPLMPAKPDPLAQDAFDIFELGVRRPLAGRKGNHKMVGAVALGALVHRLGRENFLQRQLRIRRNAVREADIRGPAFLRPKDVIRHARHHGLLLLGGAVEDVAAEAAEVRGAALAHNSLGDHGHTCPYRFPDPRYLFRGDLGKRLLRQVRRDGWFFVRGLSCDHGGLVQNAVMAFGPSAGEVRGARPEASRRSP